MSLLKKINLKIRCSCFTAGKMVNNGGLFCRSLIDNATKYLCCPHSGRPLELVSEIEENDSVKQGYLLESVSGKKYPIVNFIPRFAGHENYATSFGFQWALHHDTQYDTSSGQDVTKMRFKEETGWPEDLSGSLILEVGCGSGRFTACAVATGGMVISLDYSNAVEVTYAQNKSDNLLVVQASIYEMPLPANCADYVFCFGVLQHIPDPRDGFKAIVKKVKPGGKIAADIYKKTFFSYWLHTKYYARLFTKGMEAEKLYGMVTKYIDFIWPAVRLISKLPFVGKAINWRLLVGDHSWNLQNADDALLKKWAYLDTFDMLSPEYDIPASIDEFRDWFEENGLSNIDVHFGYNGIEGRGVKPMDATAGPTRGGENGLVPTESNHHIW